MSSPLEYVTKNSTDKIRAVHLSIKQDIWYEKSQKQAQIPKRQTINIGYVLSKTFRLPLLSITKTAITVPKIFTKLSGKLNIRVEPRSG